MEILNYFDFIKATPPMHTSRLPDTIKQLQEKSKYYKELSEKEEKEGKTAEKTEVKDEKKSSPSKKVNKAVNINNEDEFPTMH